LIFSAKGLKKICLYSILIIVIIIDLEGCMANPVRKHSRKRDAIFELMKAAVSHPGARWVYEQLKPRIPGLSLGTVYRNISLFREEGELVSVGVVNGEERFDARVEPHPHFVCTKCGRVIDFSLGESGEFTRAIEAGMGEDVPGKLSIDYRRTVFYGLCGNCKEPTQPKL
jgi:Fur family peroxide stress response transcriptional regulator